MVFVLIENYIHSQFWMNEWRNKWFHTHKHKTQTNIKHTHKHRLTHTHSSEKHTVNSTNIQGSFFIENA
jgi:hypothetical protein